MTGKSKTETYGETVTFCADGKPIHTETLNTEIPEEWGIDTGGMHAELTKDGHTIEVDLGEIPPETLRQIFGNNIPITRCKDCKYFSSARDIEDFPACVGAWNDGSVAVKSRTSPEGYCYRAERRPEK